MRPRHNTTRQSLWGTLLYNHLLSSQLGLTGVCACVRVLEREWEKAIVSMSIPVYMLLQHKVRQGEEKQWILQSEKKISAVKTNSSLGLCWLTPAVSTGSTQPVMMAGGRTCSASVGFLWRSLRRHHWSINQVKASNCSLQETVWLVEHSRQQEMRLASLWCVKTSSTVNLQLPAPIY